MRPKEFDLNLLKVLDALIAERNVTKAGQQLSRSQPAVSNSLHRLRDMLDDEILVRGPNGMTLTPRAEALRGPLREVMTLIDERIFQEASFEPSRATGVFRLAMPDRLTLAVIPPLLKRLAKMAPEVDLHLMTADRRHAVDLLEQDQIDAALGWFDDKPKHVSAEFLTDEDLFCVFRPNHPLTKSKAKFSIDAVLSYPHLVVNASGGRSAIFDELLERYNLRRRAQVSVSNYTAVPHLLKHSDMIGVFTALASVVFEQSFGLARRQVPLAVGKIATSMIWHARSDRDGKQAWLRKQIREAYNSL
jgi:DNA-binding transcriptional LysR family regulator